MPIKLDRAKGFGVRSYLPKPSPYAIACFGEQDDYRRRSALTSNLVYRDMLEMGMNKTIIEDPEFDYVVLQAFDAFRLPQKIKPIHLNDLFDQPLEIRRSSPGEPWAPMYKTRGEVMDDPACRNSIRWFWHRVKDGEDLSPPDCRVLYRAHLEKDGNPKIRAVYGYPTTLTLGEACFALPLIDEYKKGEHPIAYGYEMMCGGARRLWRDIAGYKNYLCLDYSKFDKTVSKQLIRIAFQIMLQNFNLERYQDRGVPDARRLVSMWNYIERYFVNTPLRMHDGNRFRKTAGVPSGSYFTQLVDSIVNWIMTTYAYFKQTGKLCPYLKVLGDDSVVAGDDEVCHYLMAKQFAAVGMELNTTKAIATKNINEVEFLGFGIANGFPQRKFRHWMELLYNPERPDLNWDMYASRALGLLYANSGVDPQFDYVCREVVKWKPFELTVSRDYRRFMRALGIDPDLSVDVPSRVTMLISLC